MVGPLLPDGGVTSLQLHNHALAIVVAAKSVTIPYGQEICVVHLLSGEVIFRKSAATVDGCDEDWGQVKTSNFLCCVDHLGLLSLAHHDVRAMAYALFGHFIWIPRRTTPVCYWTKPVC